MTVYDDARKVIELNGDTYSSYEVMGIFRALAAENERLRMTLKSLLEEDELTLKGRGIAFDALPHAV